MWRYIGRLFLAASTLFAPLAGPLAAHAANAPEYTVIISEAGWAGSSLSTSDEWIELTNLTSATVDLGGWTVAGAATSEGTLAIPAGSSVGPLQTFLIANYAGTHASSTLAREPDLVTTSVSLSNSSLALTLRDAGGTTRDLAGNGTAPAAGRTKSGGTAEDGTAAMVRSAPVADGTLDASWTSAGESSGFDDGAADLGTPGTIETWFVPVEPEAEDDATRTEPAAEQETPQETADKPTSEPEPAAEPDVAPTEAPSETIVEHDDPSATTTPTGEEPVESTQPPQDTGLVPAEKPIANESVAAEPDAEPMENNEPAEAAEPVDAQPTAEPLSYPAGTLILNELVSDADEEWIEVLNPGADAIALAGWNVRDASGKQTALPGDALAPGGYAVVPNPLGKLNNDGDRVELLAPDGGAVDAVEYGTAQVGAARKPDALARDAAGAWIVTTTPTPGETNRIVTRETTQTKAAPKAKPAPRVLAQPAAEPPNEAEAEPAPTAWYGPTTVRLSRLYPNTLGDDSSEEFIELENTGDAELDLAGWSLSDRSGTAYLRSDSLVIGPHAFASLARAETGIALNNTDDTVTLTAPDGTTVDSQTYESPPKGSAFVRADAGWVWSPVAATTQPGDAPEDAPAGSADARAPETPVASARVAGASGGGGSVAATVRAEGTVLVTPGVLGKQFFYLQTETGGLQIYKYDADFPELVPGDRVAVTGVLSESRGEPRLRARGDGSIVRLGTGDPVEPADADIASLTEADHGRLVRVLGTVLARSGPKAVLEYEGAKLAVRVADGTGIGANLLAKGARLQVTGILVATDTGLTLLPRSPEDVAERPDETAVAAQGAAAATAGKSAQASRERAASAAITLAVVCGLMFFSSRRLLRAAKHWYAKTRALRAATETAH